MLLRSSLSATKKFFKKTLKGFKYFLCQDYRRLPKSPIESNPLSLQILGAIDPNLSQSIKEMDIFYAEFTQRYDRQKQTSKKRRRSKARLVVSPPAKSGEEGYTKWGLGKICEVEKGEELEENKANESEGKIREKLKELEMMDKGNAEHVSDVEEALHYYSRLTCSAYVAIVDKFFMEIFAEISSMAHCNR